MILRQSANAAVHLAGGIAVGLLLVAMASLAMERQRRQREATAFEPVQDDAEPAAMDQPN